MVKILNGYKQFDPTRGSSYILDLIVNNKVNNIHKRVNVMRPLGHIEIIPTPYVTESPKIMLVIPITCNNENDEQEIENFFNMYQKYVLDVKDQAERINLFVVYLKTAYNDKTECTKYLNTMLTELIQKKYSSLMSTSTRIIKTEIDIKDEVLLKSESFKQITVIEHISKKLAPDALIFYSTICVEFQADFLNRIRLNTVLNSQIFFPIPFSSYMPNVVYGSRPFPSDIEINKNNGYFNTDSYQFVSFYNHDFILTRNIYLKNKNLIRNTKINLANQINDLYDLFSINNDLHLLRATDQSLKCRWSAEINECESLKSINYIDEMTRCLNQRKNGIGTKAQLAMHLMKNLEKIFKND